MFVVVRVYGKEGHRQRATFGEDFYHKWKDGTSVIILNAKSTGTHQFSIITACAGTLKECEHIIEGQLSDGIFENCAVGKVEKIGRMDDYLNFLPLKKYSEWGMY